MTARTHDLAAITALGIVLVFDPLKTITLSTALIALLANQIGGIAPDIDQPTAPLWRNLPAGHFAGKVFDKLLGGHRFLSHSLIGLALFSVLAYMLLNFLHPLMPHVNTQLVLVAFIIGLISHLIMDTLTKEGVPWLLPLPVKFAFPPIKELRITTGKFVETLMVFPILIIFDVWLCAQHYVALASFIRYNLFR